jgi:hypothetical protein
VRNRRLEEVLPVWGPRAQAQNALCVRPHRWRDPRKSFELEVNKKGGVRHKRDLSGDLYVMLDLDVDRGTCVTSSPATEPQINPEDASLALHRRSRRRDLT